MSPASILRGQASGPSRKIRKLVQVCIACRLKKLMILGFFSTGNQGSPLESMTVNEESVTVWFWTGP